MNRQIILPNIYNLFFTSQGCSQGMSSGSYDPPFMNLFKLTPKIVYACSNISLVGEGNVCGAETLTPQPFLPTPCHPTLCKWCFPMHNPHV